MKPIQTKTHCSEVADAAWKIHYANALVEYVQVFIGESVRQWTPLQQYATREASTILYNKLNIVVLNEVRRHVLPLRIFTDRTMSRR